MQNIYGILDSNDTHIDVSKTERGAKQYASRNGYDKVSIRFNGGYIAKTVAVKVGKKWQPYDKQI